jgi:hypothetical protein
MNYQQLLAGRPNQWKTAFRYAQNSDYQLFRMVGDWWRLEKIDRENGFERLSVELSDFDAGRFVGSRGSDAAEIFDRAFYGR